MDRISYDIKEKVNKLTVEEIVKEIETVDLSTIVPEWMKQ